MHDYELTCEPSGVVLQEILACAQASDVAWFGVVHDPKNRWAPTRGMWRRVWEALEPHLSTVEEVDRWPGSQLLVGDMAFRYLFPLSDAVVEAVVGVGESLYEWESRHSPCDPHLLYPDKSPFLTTCSGEPFAYLSINRATRERVRAEWPRLAECLSEAAPPA